MTASKDRLRLWLRLLKVVRAGEQALRDNLRREFATTLPRFDVMAALSQHPEGLKMSRLSDVLRVSGGNVTGIADRLGEEGLVERLAVPNDRRATMLRLTPAGHAEFARQAVAHEEWVDAMFSGVSAEDARAMAARLQAYALAAETKSGSNDQKEAAHAQ